MLQCRSMKELKDERGKKTSQMSEPIKMRSARPPRTRTSRNKAPTTEYPVYLLLLLS